VKTARDIANGKIKISREPKSLVEKISNYVMSLEFVKNQIFDRAKAQVLKQTGGLYPAPLKILEVIRVGLDVGGKTGYEAEAKGFGELAVTPQSKGLVNLFFGQTQCKKNRFGTPQTKPK
jgi:enoyl-CoA hydratase/long-chain 3-hydroxyacyl-CoA dehydrogenase